MQGADCGEKTVAVGKGMRCGGWGGGGGGEVCEEGLWGKVTRRRKTDLAAVTMTKKDT